MFGAPQRGVLVLVATAALVFSACGGKEATPCYAGDYQACNCAGAPHGYQRCAADGQGYGACDCSGAIPGVPGSGDAGTDTAVTPPDSGTDAGGLLPFMSVCEADAECSTGNCYSFNAKGKRCSKACTTATDCPPPSTGCNGMGICKAP